MTIQAATITKANNTTRISDTGSWVGGVAPTSADVGLFDSTITTALTTGNLSANTTGGSLQFTTIGGNVGIGIGANASSTTYTLSLNTTYEIDMSSSAADVTIGTATAPCGFLRWASGAFGGISVAPGRTLTLNANISNQGNTKTMTMTGGGNIILNAGAGTGGAMSFSIQGGTTVTMNSSWGGSGSTREIIYGTLNVGSDTALNGTLNLGGTSANTPTLAATGGTRAMANGITLLATSVGGNPTIAGANDLTINGVVQNSGASRTLTVNNSGLTTFAGGLNLSEGTSTRTVTINGTGNTTISSVVANGGTATSGNLTYAGSGTLTLSGANTYAGTTAINGGVVVANVAEVASPASGPFGAPSTLVGSLTFNGGKLKYSANNAVDYSGRFSTGGSQSISIDTAGQNVSFGTAIVGSGTTLTLADSSGTPGSLTIAASGNTYSGATTINSGGTLRVNGTVTGTGTVAVNSGGTLSGSGSLSGAVTMNSGGQLSPGANGVGTLTVGSLNLSSSTCTNNFEFSSSSSYDKISVSGNLSVTGGKFNLYQTGGTLAWITPGTYNIATYGGANPSLDSTWTTADSANPHIANPQTGYKYAFAASGGILSLTISATVNNGTWSGATGGAWSVSGNWTAVVGTMPPNGVGDTATFPTESGQYIVNLDANETVGTLNFNSANSFILSNSGGVLTLDKAGSGALINVTDGTANSILAPLSFNDNVSMTVSSAKSLAISGTISGAGKTLTVNGAGALSLSGNNSYGPSSGTPGTTLSGGGTLQLGHNNALGSGDLNVTASATIQAGATVSIGNNITLGTSTTATVDSSGNSLTLGGVISGTGGALTKIGNGSLTFGNPNTYFNNTTVSAGTLKLGTANAIPNGGSTTGALVLNAGATAGTFDMNGFSQTVNALSGSSGASLGQIVNNSGSGTSTLTVSGNQATTFAGLIEDNNNSTSGKVALTVSGSGTLTLAGANSYSGGTTISAGQLNINNNSALGSGALTISGGTIDNTSSGDVTLGNIPQSWNGDLIYAGTLHNLNLGNGAVTLGATRQVTVSANTVTVGGVISGSFGLTKAGSGTLVLNGNNAYTGVTTVNGGVLQLNSSGVINNSSADSIANVSGTELFINGGSFTGASLNIATPSAGLLVSSGAVIITGALTMNNGSSSEASQNGLIALTGGSLSVGSLGMGRMGVFFNAQPTAGATDYGFYVNGGSGNVSGNLSVCGQTVANSANSMRIDSGGLTIGGSITLGGGSSAGRWTPLDVNGGTLTVNDTATGINIGYNNNGSAAGCAELLVRGGTATVGKIGLGGTSGYTGTAVLNETGGSLYIGSGGIIDSGFGTRTITLNGGTLGAAADWSSSMNMTLGGTTIKAAASDDTAHNITLSGQLGGAAALTKTGNGTLTLAGGNFFNGGVNLNAGTLNINGSWAVGGAVYGGMTFNGGMLQYAPGFSGNGPGDISQNTAATPVAQNVTFASTATIDVNGNNVSFANAVGHSGAGGLIVKSTLAGGSLTLNGANSYAGNTTVSSGSLFVNGSVAAGITVNSGAALQPGTASTIGTLTLGNSLSLAGTANFRLNKTGAVLSNDRIAGASSITGGGALSVTAAGDALASGDSFTLFNAGINSGWFTNVNLPAPGSGLAWDTNHVATAGVLDVYNFTTTTLTISNLVNTPVTISAAKLAGHASSSKASAPYPTSWSAAASTPAHGTASFSSGALTYTPTADYAGNDTFTVTFLDGHGVQTMTVNVSMASQNVGPTITPVAGPVGSFSASGLPNTIYTIQISTNLTDVTPFNDYVNVTSAPNGVINYTDDLSIEQHNGQAYYRLKQYVAP